MPLTDDLSAFVTRLRQRKIGRWALTYLAGAWLVLQVLSLIGDRFDWPDLWLRILIVVLAVGFFAALVLAWYHGERGAQRVSGTELAILTVLFVIAGVGVTLVGGDDEAGTAQAAAPAPAGESPVEQASIAVLPFQNLSSDAEQEYFSDGLTEELLNVLAQIPGLRVAARTSSFAFKGEEIAVDSIGRALRVAYLIEGSVRKAGERIRITAQLIDAASGFHQWSQMYDRELKDVFAVQEEISRAIANELRVRVGGESLASRKSKDPEAYELFLRGMQLLQQSGSNPRGNLAEAERLFQAALERDPQFAAALAGLAQTHRNQVYAGLIDLDKGYEQARGEARRSLALDAGEAMAHLALAFVTDSYDRDYEAAAEHYRRSLELNPSDSRARSNYAWLLMRLGRKAEALREGQRAVEIDPLSVAASANLGSLYAFARQYERAVEYYQAALALDSANLITLLNLAVLYSQLGKHTTAIETARRGLALDPDLDYALCTLAYVYARADRRTEAQQELRRLEHRPNVSPYLLATVHVALGNTDLVFQLLEQAATASDDYIVDINMDPVFDPLRDDPRMEGILEKIGLD